MFKYRAVAYVKPSLAPAKGFLTILLLSSLKSDIVRTVRSFFGVINVGEAHCEYGCHFITPIDTNQSISFMRVALWIFGIGYGLPWNGFAPSFNSKETGGRFQLPKVPSNNCSNLSSSASSGSLSDGFRCLQLSLTIPGMSALSYLASRISTTLLVAFHVISGSWARHVLC